MLSPGKKKSPGDRHFQTLLHFVREGSLPNKSNERRDFPNQLRSTQQDSLAKRHRTLLSLPDTRGILEPSTGFLRYDCERRPYS